jgi:polyhydroxyalkanoate synthesis regulator phasin
MLNVKENAKKLITDIYECQKKIIINRRYIQDLISEGNRNAVTSLQEEITRLQVKIREFQGELNQRFSYSNT